MNKSILAMSLLALSLFSGTMTVYAAGPGEAKETQVNIVTYNQEAVKALGNWEQQSNGTWVFKQFTGGVLTNSWIESLSEAGAYYYVGADGVMLINGTTPDGYSVNSDGLWRAETAQPTSQVETERGAEPNPAEYTSSDEYYRDLANWILSEPGTREEISRLTIGQKDVTLN